MRITKGREAYESCAYYQWPSIKYKAVAWNVIKYKVTCYWNYMYFGVFIFPVEKPLVKKFETICIVVVTIIYFSTFLLSCWNNGMEIFRSCDSGFGWIYDKFKTGNDWNVYICDQIFYLYPYKILQQTKWPLNENDLSW